MRRDHELCSILQLFGLSDSGERIAQASINECVDPLQDLTVSCLPVLVVLPRGLVPNQTHSGFLISTIEVVVLGLPCAGTFVGIEQAASVCRRAEQVCCLLPRGVLVSGHEDGVALARDDLDGIAILVHSLNEREQGLACLTCADRHHGPFHCVDRYNFMVPLNPLAGVQPDKQGTQSRRAFSDQLAAEERARGPRGRACAEVRHPILDLDRLDGNAFDEQPSASDLRQQRRLFGEVEVKARR